MDLKLSENAFSLIILILLSGKVTEMDENDFDYEEPSLDPFEGEFSGSDDCENEVSQRFFLPKLTIKISKTQ